MGALGGWGTLGGKGVQCPQSLAWGLSPLAGPDLHPPREAGHPVKELLPSFLKAALAGAGLEEGVLGSAAERAGQRPRRWPALGAGFWEGAR